MKSPEQWLKASKGRHARMKMPCRPHTEQSGKVSSNIWTTHKSKNEEEEEEEDCQKENQMEVRWTEDEKLEVSFGTKKDGRMLSAGGSHAKDTRVSGA